MNIVTKIVLAIIVPTIAVMLYGVVTTLRFGPSATAQLITYGLILLTIVASAAIATRRIVSGRLSRLTARVREIDVAREKIFDDTELIEVVVDDIINAGNSDDSEDAHSEPPELPTIMVDSREDGDALVHLAKALDDAVAEWWSERDMLRRLLRSRERELKEAKTALSHESKRADDSVAAKREFLSNISHEIRTPMNGIMGMCELLLDSDVKGEEREYARTIRQCAESLMVVMTDVTDLSRLAAGELTVDPIPCDLATTIQGLVDVYTRRANDKNLELRLRYDPVAPRHLLVDAARVRQVISSLLSNAVKFTEKGSVTVSVNAIRVTNTHAHMRISVEDTGIGIAQDKLSYIFESFTQVDSSMSRSYGGTGLGLAVCKQLATLMDGEVEVASKLGKGSRFSFTATFAADARHGTGALELASLEGARALFVDGNPVTRRVLERYLSRWGLRADIVGDPTVVMSIMREASESGDPYDLCIIDFHMPQLNGEELARTIKSDPAIGNTPLVVMTSVSARGDAKRLRDAGFAAYLVKPVPHERLREALSAVLGGGDADEHGSGLITQHTLAEHRTATGEGSPEATVCFMGRVLIAEDNPVNQMLAKRLLEKLGLDVDVAPNGKVAVERVAKSDYDLIFMDCQMPVMDGIEATERVRAAEKDEVGVPIVAMTANALQQERTRCLAAGMDDFITKPVDVGMLREIVSRFLPSKTREMEIDRLPTDEGDRAA